VVGTGACDGTTVTSTEYTRARQRSARVADTSPLPQRTNAFVYLLLTYFSRNAIVSVTAVIPLLLARVAGTAFRL